MDEQDAGAQVVAIMATLAEEVNVLAPAADPVDRLLGIDCLLARKLAELDQVMAAAPGVAQLVQVARNAIAIQRTSV